MKTSTTNRLARAAGVLFGSIIPKLDTSELDDDDSLSRAFKRGFADGKIARTLGDVLTAATTRTEDEEDEQ